MGEYKVSYKNVGKANEIKDSSRTFIPTKTFLTLFAVLFFGCSIISMMNISLTSLFSMDGTTIEIGFPFTFLKIGGLTQSSLVFGGLILDLLIYLVISYAINIIINLIKGSLQKNPKEVVKEIKIPKK